MYGSVLVSLLTKQHQRLQNQPNSVRQRSLQGIGQSDIQLLRVNTNDDDSTPSNATESTIVSNSSWRYSMEERLPEFGDEDPSSVAVKARDMAESLANSLSNTSAMEAQLRADAELHARSVKILPAGETRKRALKCIGWRQTGHKSPNGPREPENDLTCTDLVSNKASGYCEVEDINSGERFRVMRRSSNILRNRVPFRCINAPAFAQYHIQAHAAVKSTLDPNDASRDLPPQDGIVMVVYPKLIPSAYATIRALRVILGCSLPIEIWYRPDEMEHVPNALVPLRHLANNSSGARISFHPITDPAAKRFVTKIYAINHSFFDRVLFLDADNVPVRDPSFLFNSPEFLETGAIFWPDFWHPTSTMFGLHSRSLLWELLDMPFVDMFEQESGQLVVDRRRHAAPLKLVLFYATHEPNFFAHYKLAWGDKDLFRLAWLKLNAPFHMVETPPAMAGMVTNSSAFCGMTMVQHDPEGDVLFLHRNKSSNMTTNFQSWWIKPLAMYHTDIRHVMLLDVDDVIMKDPAVLRDLDGYMKTGTTFFYDRVAHKKRFLNGNDHGRYYLRRLLREFDYARFNVSRGFAPSQHVLNSFAYKGKSCHEMDSSMVLIDKERAGNTVMKIMFWFITEERFRFKYSWGDKETFWLAFELAHVTYTYSPWGVSVVNSMPNEDMKRHPDALCGSILQFVPIDNSEIEVLYVNGKALIDPYPQGVAYIRKAKQNNLFNMLPTHMTPRQYRREVNTTAHQKEKFNIECLPGMGSTLLPASFSHNLLRRRLHFLGVATDVIGSLQHCETYDQA
ncbi:putative Mannosyltransferase [Phytophthora infestans]|uniref:Putative Mannosyltransferase n=1 Tax=Phytophthora infestans TaxID=4787 RepID=A0A8S9U0A8_PHYIN|nr:putative Mannosyltransferase [Phytophthora infestans]